MLLVKGCLSLLGDSSFLPTLPRLQTIQKSGIWWAQGIQQQAESHYRRVPTSSRHVPTTEQGGMTPCATCIMHSTKFYWCNDNLSTICRHPIETIAPTRSLDILTCSSKALSFKPSKISRWKRRDIQWKLDIWWPQWCHGRSTFWLPWNKLPMEKIFVVHWVFSRLFVFSTKSNEYLSFIIVAVDCYQYL